AFQAVALEKPATAPLAVSLSEPKDQSRFAAERLTLTGKVTGGSGAVRVAVTLNGTEIARPQPSGPPGAQPALSVPAKLALCKDPLIVTATDAAGGTRQEGRVLFYDKPAPVVAAPAPPKPTAPPQPSPPPAAPPVTATPSPSQPKPPVAAAP